MCLDAFALILGAVERNVTEGFTESGLLGELQYLHEQLGQRLQVPAAENSEIVRKSADRPPTIIMKSARSTAALVIRRDE